MDERSFDVQNCYQLRVLRLLNFHNFTDETIPLHGSLFLIGNNGTGKTTIVDAIQLALTGGQQLTYNAATIVNPRMESGRTLAGVILRHDFETGRIGRENGAVGYSALELVQPKTGHVLSIGVGAFVQSLDQRPDVWGFIVEDHLRNIPLTVRVNPNDPGEPQYRPVDKRELMEIVGKAHVYDIGRYRTQLANRLFGGREQFERFADLLKASKSYKELVVKARDFEGLFALLLPAPDHQVFQDIEATLQNLDKIESDLKALRQERDLLEEAQRVVERIGAAREAVERYKYVQARTLFENVDREAATLQRAIYRNEEAIAAARAQLEKIIPQLERTRSVLAELRIGEPGRLLEELARLEQERARTQEEYNARAAELEAEQSKARTLERDCRRAQDDLSEVLQEQLRALDRVELPVLPNELSRAELERALGALVTAYRAITPDTLPDMLELRRLQTAVNQAIDALIARLREEAQPLTLRRSELQRQHATVEAETVGAGPAVEFLPNVPGYAEFAAELDHKNIEWAPLYRLIDVSDKAPRGFCDALEAFLGEAFLGTVFVAPEHVDTVVRIARAKYPGIIIANTAALDYAAPTQRVPDSVCRWIVTSGHPYVQRFLDLNLGHMSVAETMKLRRGDACLTLEGVAYVGGAFRILHQPARGLLGSARRHAAMEAKRNEHAARLAELATQIADLDERLNVLNQAEASLQGIRGMLDERVAPWLIAHRVQQLLTAQQQLRDVKERVARLSATVARVQKQVTQLTEQIETIRSSKATQTTGDLARKTETLKKQILTLERERDHQQEIIARHTERLEVARQNLQELDRRREDLQRALDTQRASLQALVPAPHRDDLNHYVDEVCGGRSIKFSDLPALIREQERLINREIGSLVGLEEQGHKGRSGLLHHELLWTKYAFTYHEETNELRDQNNVPIGVLYDRLVQQVEQLETTVNERRRKLLEKTILGDLSNQYTRDLYRLRESLNAVNNMLEGLTFGRAQYKFTQRIKPEYRQVYGIVRRAGAIDPESQQQLKAFFESRLEQLRLQPDGTLPKFLDYRHWFDYQLHVKTVGASDGIELTNEIRRLGSGGEQAVPNYLLIMAMGALLFNQIGARVRILLFDEAFYGIDAARRDELLRFASRLGLTLVVATPEMDGVTEAMRESTTLLLEKNEQNEVFIGNFTWESKEGVQMDIFAPASERAEDYVVKT